MLSVSESGSDRALLTWTSVGGGRPEREAENTWAALEGALAERGAVPIQERIFGTLKSAPDVACGRARAVGDGGERWSVPPTHIEGAPVGHDGLAGIHVLAARAEASRFVMPMVTTVADVSREDLLFEIDATAVLPLGQRGSGR